MWAGFLACAIVLCKRTVGLEIRRRMKSCPTKGSGSVWILIFNREQGHRDKFIGLRRDVALLSITANYGGASRWPAASPDLATFLNSDEPRKCRHNSRHSRTGGPRHAETAIFFANEQPDWKSAASSFDISALAR
jgi:hypothetical protein